MNDMFDRSVPNMRSAPLPPDQPMSATLTAQEWNVVFTALNEVPLPLRIARPVFDKLMAQLNQIPSSG